MEDLDSIILIKDKSTPNPFSHPEIKIADVNASADLLTLKSEIESKIRPHLKSDFEVALSLASGNGKQHMATLSALLNLPVGIKLVAFTKKGVEFLT
jgi:hypothetical protein